VRCASSVEDGNFRLGGDCQRLQRHGECSDETLRFGCRVREVTACQERTHEFPAQARITRRLLHALACRAQAGARFRLGFGSLPRAQLHDLERGRAADLRRATPNRPRQPTRCHRASVGREAQGIAHRDHAACGPCEAQRRERSLDTPRHVGIPEPVVALWRLHAAVTCDHEAGEHAALERCVAQKPLLVAGPEATEMLAYRALNRLGRQAARHLTAAHAHAGRTRRVPHDPEASEGSSAVQRDQRDVVRQHAVAPGKLDARGARASCRKLQLGDALGSPQPCGAFEPTGARRSLESDADPREHQLRITGDGKRSRGRRKLGEALRQGHRPNRRGRGEPCSQTREARFLPAIQEQARRADFRRDPR
jgi:hypothetical protein